MSVPWSSVRRYTGPTIPRFQALVGLGIVQLRLRKLRDARGSLEHALTISKGVYGPCRLKVAKTLIYLGVIPRRKIAKYLTSIFLRLDERQR